MDLTTVERVYKFDSALPDTKDREVIQMIITGLSARVESYLGRFIKFRDYTEVFDVAQFSENLFLVKGFPMNLADPIFLARTATAYDVSIGLAAAVGDPLADTPNGFYFRNAGTDIPIDELNINAPQGAIAPTVGALREGGLGQVEIRYWGGMAKDTAEFISKYPDLEYGFLLQVIFDYKRKKNLSMVSVGAGGNSAETYIPFQLRDEFKRQLRTYRRAGYVN